MTIESASFGSQLRRQRLAAGLTQEELAERAGLSARGIQDLERGARRAPHPETVRRLTAALGRLDDAPPTPPSIPSVPTSFVGRERAVADLGSMLLTSRLITLTGTGGIGKTRLALEVASTVAPRYEGAVWMVDLSPVVDGELVVHSVASTIGLREQPVRTLIETVCEFISGRSVLLVLDNCEHLLEACVALIDTLIRRCPGVRVLATSREPLRATGEVVWRVPSLGMAAAKELFLERARTAGAAPPTERGALAIGDLCHRLEGVPLAIELAAVRNVMFSVEQLVSLLDDAFRLLTTGTRSAPLRHRTLRATIEWSYNLLTPAEQVLLERLSVFVGGWTLAAAESVCRLDRDDWDVLDLLGRLVDRSLVIAEPAKDGTLRYRLQEVLRQFTHERLEARPDANEVRSRHASYFMHVVRESERRSLTGERRVLLDRIELEMDNLRAARRWFVGRRDGKAAQRFGAGLYRLLMYRGHATEGRQSLVNALALPGGSSNTRAKAMQCLAALAFTQADYADAAEYGAAGLALHRQIDEPHGLTYAFIGLGMTATVRGSYALGSSLLAEARQASRRTVGTLLVPLALAISAHVEYLRGEYDVARQFAQQAIETGKVTGFTSQTCMAMVTLGNLSYLAGDCPTAAELLGAGLTEAEDLAETYLILRAAIPLALLSADQGDEHGARRLLDDGLNRALQLGNHYHVAQVLEGVAAFAAAQQRDQEALRLAAAGSVIRAAIGAPLSPTEQRMLAIRLDPVRSALGEATVAAVSAEANTWPIDLASARARAILIG
jgi:predicted ATPase/DNA-binding XRE family transcriptional regulator